MKEKTDSIRLQVRLARGGIGSRRRCETYIAEKRVRVNGVIVTEPGTKVSDDDEVTFDGAGVRTETRKVYVALHKPAGFLCSDEDPDGRPLAKNLIKVVVKERIFHVGRLDYMTSGLIFYTNDGEFARRLTHPGSHVEKEYQVTTKNEIPQELMDRFLKGLVVEGVRYKASEAEKVAPHTARIVLTEGKNRELRRVFLSSNVRIKKVHRIRIGSIYLKGIESGHFRYLKESEVKALLAEASGEKRPRKSPVRTAPGAGRPAHKPMPKSRRSLSGPPVGGPRKPGGSTSSRGRTGDKTVSGGKTGFGGPKNNKNIKKGNSRGSRH